MNQGKNPEINLKIIYISEHIDLLENTNVIINYINHHNINYSHNSNGLFINLSLLEDQHIIYIANIISESLKVNMVDDKDILPIISTKKEKDKIYKPLELSPAQKDILNSIF